MHTKDDKNESFFKKVVKQPLESEKTYILKQLSLFPVNARDDKIYSFFKKIYTFAQNISESNLESSFVRGLQADVRKKIVNNYIRLLVSEHFKFIEEVPPAQSYSQSSPYSTAHLRNKSGGCNIRHK